MSHDEELWELGSWDDYVEQFDRDPPIAARCRSCHAPGPFVITPLGLQRDGKTHNCFDTWRHKYGAKPITPQERK